LTQTGANDPDSNLNIQLQYLIRQKNKKQHIFVSIIETHGFFDPVKEAVVQPRALIKKLNHLNQGDYDIVSFEVNGEMYLYTLSRKLHKHKHHTIDYMGTSYSWEEPQQLIKL
jgi:hypothetical protein